MAVFVQQGQERLVELQPGSYGAESELQALIAEHPHVLGKWILVKREARISGASPGTYPWRLDHLFLDQTGTPTLVEVKRADDSRIRREVVGQMLDYAANLVKYWPPDFIRSSFRQSCAQRALDETQEISRFLEPETDAEAFWLSVNTKVQAGRLRLVFVADLITPELQRVVEFLNEKIETCEIIAVEIRRFSSADSESSAIVSRTIGDTSRAQAQRQKPRDFETWQDVAYWTENESVRSFILNEAERLGANPTARKLWYRCQGQNRWRLQVQKQDVNVYQVIRFAEDLQFWRRTFPDIEFRTPNNNNDLAFNLSTEAQLEKFKEAITNGCDSFVFLKPNN